MRVIRFVREMHLKSLVQILVNRILEKLSHFDKLDNSLVRKKVVYTQSEQEVHKDHGKYF